MKNNSAQCYLVKQCGGVCCFVWERSSWRTPQATSSGALHYCKLGVSLFPYNFNLFIQQFFLQHLGWRCAEDRTRIWTNAWLACSRGYFRNWPKVAAWKCVMWFSKCLLFSGIPEINVERFEPLLLDKVSISKGTGPVTLAGILTNLTVAGPSKAVPTYTMWDSNFYTSKFIYFISLSTHIWSKF